MEEKCITCSHLVKYGIKLDGRERIKPVWYCPKFKKELCPHDNEKVVECDAYDSKTELKEAVVVEPEPIPAAPAQTPPSEQMCDKYATVTVPVAEKETEKTIEVKVVEKKKRGRPKARR